MEETPERLLKFYGSSHGRSLYETCEMPITFIASDGYVPVIKMADTVRKGQNYFNNTRTDYTSVKRSMKNGLNLAGGMGGDSFKTPRTVLDRNKRVAPSLMTGYMTALMIKENGQYTEHEFDMRNKRAFRLQNEIDIMVLGLYDMSKISEMTSSLEGYRNMWRVISVNPKYIKLIISENLMNAKWMKANYSAVIRKHLIAEVARVVAEYKFPQSIVSVDEMRNYTRVRSTIKTNSLIEIMKIDKDIKDEVFQNVKLEKLFV